MSRFFEIFTSRAVSCPAVLRGCRSGESPEVFAEERGVGKVHVVGNLGDGFVGVFQFDLDAQDEGAVNPLLGCDVAGLADDGAQIASGEAHL